MDHMYVSTDAHLILLKQPYGACPLPSDQNWETPPAGDDILTLLNQFIFIDTRLDPTSPFYSFNNLIINSIAPIISWVFHNQTGEGRFYDGNQGFGMAGDPTLFWNPMQRALGKVHGIDYGIERAVMEDGEIGSMRPSALKGMDYVSKLSFDKTWIDRSKIEGSPSRTNPTDHQFSMLGPEVVSVESFINSLKQNYHAVILYVADGSARKGLDVLNISRTLLAPCTMFDTFKSGVKEKDKINCSMSAKSTYMMHFPRPYDNIAEYSQTFSVPTCILLIEVMNETQSNQNYPVGDVAGIEYWYGEGILAPISTHTICAIEAYIDTKTGGSLPDYRIVIYPSAATGVPTGPAIPNGTSNLIAGAALVAGAWNRFTFPVHPTLVAAQYYTVGLEHNAAAPTDNYVNLAGANGTNPYADGNMVFDASAVYGNLGTSWSASPLDDLCFRIFRDYP